MTTAAIQIVTLNLEGPIEFRTHLPKEMGSVKYVRNHHYIEFTDADGNVLKLVAKSLVKGKCSSSGCAGEIFVESRLGSMICPHCQSAVNWVWGKAQLSFVPEIEARFSSGPSPVRSSNPTKPKADS